jgi:hypothetical protein
MEKYRLRVFEKRVLGRIFCTKRMDFKSRRRRRRPGHVARMGEECIWNICGKVRNKDTTRKTRTQMGGEY